MKKSFLILLLPALLTGCKVTVEVEHDHIDSNNDHLCDICNQKYTNCIDQDEDGICDICGKEYYPTMIGINIKKQPNKVKYYVGEVFDPTGMVVNAVYDNDTYAPVDNYSYSKAALKIGDSEIEISYEQFTASVAIQVIDKPVVQDEYTATIKLSGTSFSAVATEAGVQFDDSGYSRNVEILKEYCDSGLEYEDLIKSINCSHLNTAEWEQGAALCIGTGYYAKDKFQAGTFKWNSGVKIYRVELKARAYTKRNDYSGDIIDTPAHVQLDGDDLELMPEGATKAEVKTISKDYIEGVNSFSITSTGARVVVQEVTITWRG